MRERRLAYATFDDSTFDDAVRAPGRATLTRHLMRRASGDSDVAPDAESAVERAGGGGAPLPGELRERFEASIGADLSHVRVHTGTDSSAAARSVGAKAYALGQDIHFGYGHYDPTTQGGQVLIAHEVAHTVQQRGGSQTPRYKLEMSSAGDAVEVEADRAADAMVRGAPAMIGAASGLARKIMRSEATPPAGGGAEGGGAPAVATPIPDPGAVGRDPKHPLPDVAKAEVETQYAGWKVRFFQDQLRQIENLGNMPGRGPITGSPQYLATAAKAQGYQTDAARFPEMTSAWTSFMATGNLAGAQLADHIAMKDRFGFADLSKTLAGLSKKDKDQIGDDLAKMEAAQGKISIARGKLSSAARHLGPQQLRFIGSSKELAGFMTSTVANELRKKLAEAKEKKEEIQKSIENAASIGDGIQHALQDVVGAFTAVTSVEVAAEEKVDELLAKAKEFKEHGGQAVAAPEGHTLLGTIVEKIAQKAYKQKIEALNGVIRAAAVLLDSTELTAHKQTLEGLKTRMDADLNEMLATLEDLGAAAKELNDAMNAAEQIKLHAPPSNGSTAPQPSDAARKVEEFTASGMAASALLDPAIASGETARNQILSIAGSSKAMRAMPWYSAPKHGAYTNEGDENNPNRNAFAEQQGELHADDGTTGPDMAMIDGMMLYLARWVEQAQMQKGAIAQEIQQVESLKA